MNNKYYLSIDSSNLGEYFSRALIVPQIHFEGFVKDLQSIHPEHLMLTKEKFINKSDCCIEVILSDKEKANLETHNDLIFIATALPISRISRILFFSKEKMERTIDLARSSSFIPERLILLVNKLDYSPFEKNIEKVNLTPLKNNLEKINFYNKILGGMAFMRFGGENYMNYSENYFNTLNYFNNSIDDEIKSQKLDLGKYHGLFENKENTWKEVNKLIFGTSESIISYVKDKIPTKNNKYQLDKIKTRKLYTYGIIATYGPEQFKSSTTDSLFQALLTGKILNREVVTLFYGIHNGYRSFRNTYTLNNGFQNVKFELASRLDYHIIESIYQYAFYDKKHENFDFLNSVIPINSKNINTQQYKTYTILDEKIIYGKLPTSIREVLSNYFKNNIFSGVISGFINNFQKKNNIVLTIDQSNKISDEYRQIIKEPIRLHLEELEKEILNFSNIKSSNYENEIKKLKKMLADNDKRHYELSLMLRTADKNLFDEIDTNKNGTLELDEIVLFMGKLNKAKQHLNDIMDTPFTDKAVEISEVIPKQKTNELTEEKILIHKYYLTNMTPAVLKKEAKKLDIPVRNKITEENKSLLIDQIINKSKTKLF